MFSRLTVFLLTLLLLVPLGVSAKAPSRAALKKLVKEGAACRVVQATRCKATKALVTLGKPAILGLSNLFKTSQKHQKAVIIAALGDLRATSMGGAILREIKSKDPVVRHAAIVAVARLKPPGSVKALAAALGKVDPNEKAMVAAALGQTRSPGALQPLLSALKHPHPRVQMTVVQALAQLGQKGVYEALEGFASKKELSPPVKIALLKAYGLLGDKRATTWVSQALRDGDKVRKNALKALGALRDPKGVSAILPLLKEEAWVLEAVHVLGLTGSADALPGLIRIIRGQNVGADVLEKTFWAIGETRASSVVATLTPFLKDARTDIAAWAAGALGRIGDKKAAFALFAALKSDDKNLKSMAVWALEKVSGKRLGTEPSRWESWVFEQRK